MGWNGTMEQWNNNNTVMHCYMLPSTKPFLSELGVHRNAWDETFHTHTVRILLLVTEYAREPLLSVRSYKLTATNPLLRYPLFRGAASINGAADSRSRATGTRIGISTKPLGQFTATQRKISPGVGWRSGAQAVDRRDAPPHLIS